MDHTNFFGFFVLEIFLVCTSLSSLSFGEESIKISSYVSEISQTDSLFVYGHVIAKTFYQPVELEVYSPTGNLVFKPSVDFDDNGNFKWLLHPPFGKFNEYGTYTIIASHDDLSQTSQLQFTVSSKTLEALKLQPRQGQLTPEITLNQDIGYIDFVSKQDKPSKSDEILETMKLESGKLGIEGGAGYLERVSLLLMIIIVSYVILGMVIFLLRRKRTLRQPQHLLKI